MSARIDPEGDIERGMTVSDYTLKYGVFASFTAERAMLILLADPHRPVRGFIDTLHDQPREIIELYASEGGFPHAAYHPALSRLRDDRSLVETAIQSARRWVQTDEVYQNLTEASSPFDPGPADLVRSLLTFSDYAARLPRKRRRRLEELWSVEESNTYKPSVRPLPR